MKHLSSAWFLLGFSVAYPLLLGLNKSVILYYPLIRQWSFTHLDNNPGPEMQWYGLMLAATAAGLALSPLPERWLPGAVRQRIVVAPVFAMLACVVLLRGFFT